MNLKERIAALKNIAVKVKASDGEVVMVAAKTTMREIEMFEIITLQQEIIQIQQEGLNSAQQNFKKICNEDDLGLVSRYSLAAMREIDKSLEKTKEKTGE